jgi:hypothetical protein
MDDKNTITGIIENENAHRPMATPLTREKHINRSSNTFIDSPGKPTLLAGCVFSLLTLSRISLIASETDLNVVYV